MGSTMPMSRLEAHLNHKDGVATRRSGGKLLVTLDGAEEVSIQSYRDVRRFGWTHGNVYGDGDMFLRPY